MNKCLLLFILLLISPDILAQGARSAQNNASPEKLFLRARLQTLCGKKMHGRGYVNNGRLLAADYVRDQFKTFGLIPVTPDGYFQTYTFPVNSFPDEVALSVNGRKLKPGVDYLIDASSHSIHTGRQEVETVDLQSIHDSADWQNIKSWMGAKDKVYLLQNIDSLVRRLSLRMHRIAKDLPPGCYLIPQHGKLTWTVATSVGNNTVFIVEDTVLPNLVHHARTGVDAAFDPSSVNENVAAMVPGEVKDSFIVFTAHYDHLGRMGSKAMFPGASDNASGTSMLLYLAHYFAAHPQHYTMLFIAFSGEEAGLKGSEYFVAHPLVPLDHLRFLTNLDMVGDATGGITVVNATTFIKEFSLLKQINDNNHYVVDIKSRDKAANSDHYHFTQAGVPSFFIYSNGGKYYHDIFDKANTLSLFDIDKLARLLIDFAVSIR